MDHAELSYFHGHHCAHVATRNEHLRVSRKLSLASDAARAYTRRICNGVRT